MHVTASGGWRVITDLAAYEATVNPGGRHRRVRII
jgi:hypothetical protein